MTDDLARRMAARQIETARAELARDAERLAATCRQYADEIAGGRGGGTLGGARRLAQDAADLALQERHLAGLRTITDLISDEPT